MSTRTPVHWQAAALVLMIMIAAGAMARSEGRSGATITRVDPRLDRLLAKDAAVEKIADGLSWVEGPVWHPAGYLLFSDIPRNAILKWLPGHGVSVFLQPSGYTGVAPFTGREPGSNGLALDRLGRLVISEHGDRRISRLDPNGTRTTLADRYNGKRLNSPNDVIVASNGDLYFTDPPFGLPRSFADPDKELAFSGVYRLRPTGVLELLTTELSAPNGIALSPDERVLYVSNADRARAWWLAFPILADGSLGPSRVLHDGTKWAADRPGAPDGLKVDVQGNLFAAGPGGVYVFAPDGTHLGTIELGVATSNTAWGEDGSTLYITASTAVFRVPTRTKGWL